MRWNGEHVYIEIDDRRLNANEGEEGVGSA